MADNKLLGVLELNPGKVLDTINQVNSALQNLGKGVDLNLTNILNAKVNSQLKELKQQIDDINKAAATPGGGSGKTSQIKAINDLLTQQYNAQLKLANLENRSNVNQNQVRRQQDLLDEAQTRLRGYDQEKVQLQETLTRFQNMQKRVDDARAASADRAIQMQQKSAAEQESLRKKQWADDIAASKKSTEETLKAIEQKRTANAKAQDEENKMTLNSLEQRTEAVRNTAQEEQKARKEQWAAEIAAFKKNTDDTVKLIETKRAANQQASEKETEMTLAGLEMRTEAVRNASQEQLKNATQVYKEQLEIEKKLAAGTAGPNETAELNRQLAEKKQAFSEYGKSIQDAAKADASVIKAQQDVAMANAQAQDRVLKENQKAQEEAARAAEANAKKMQDYRKQWANYAVSALGAASLAVLKKQWTEAVDYATKYYDALNEIRIVSNDMSQQDVDQFGQKMRDIAEEMKVTSTELSQAAITFFRQGLEPAEVEDRLRWVTEYAKVAHMEFDEAAQLMTAAINTMGDSIQESGFENVVEHIADVWLYLGDNAATSGEEIGKAMQKASASAQEFGMSFEWLGTYIAVVSEQTRQAPEAIGNAFNTMMARMHQIKANGFNDEDTTKLNDVAKALATINVELMDSDGEWRDMSDIYSDIADKWGEMDAKQRGYIATTMAGTRQQNVFYALMNDLSKGIEGGSRAWELYAGAMNAAGTATEKYAIYQQSIEASQANLTNSLEQLYSNVMKPDAIKGFYNVITVLVDGLNNLGGVFPVVTSGIVGFTAAIVAAKAGLIDANPLIVALTAALGMLVSLVAMGGIGQLFGALFGGDDGSAQRYEEATEKYREAGKNIKELQGLQSTLEGVWDKQASGAKLSSSELAQYNAALEKVASLSPEAAGAVEALTSGLGDQAEAINKVKIALEEELEAEKARQQYAAEQRLNNWTADKRIFTTDGREVAQASGRSVLEELKNFGYDGTTESLTASAIQAYFESAYSFVSEEAYRSFVQYYHQALNDASTELGRTVDELNNASDAKVFGEKLYRNLIGDILGGKEYEALLESEMNRLISDVLQYLGSDLDVSEKALLTNKLKEIIIGPDGVLTSEDLDNNALLGGVVDKVKAFARQFKNDAEKVFAEEDYSELMQTFWKGVFGADLSESEAAEAVKTNGAEWIKGAYKAYEELLSSGISGEGINAIFRSVNSSNWGVLSFDNVFSHLMGGSRDSYKEVSPEIKAMIIDMRLLGTTVEEVDQMLADSENIGDFANKIKKAFGSGKSGGTDDASMTLKSFIETAKEMKDTTAIQDALASASNSLDTINTKGLEALSTSIQLLGDMFGARTNEESYADWVQRMRSAFEELKKMEADAGPSLDEFKAFAKQAEEAKAALDKLTADEGISPTDQEKQQGILNEIFGDFDLKSLEGTDQYIARATELVNQLIAAVTTEALNHGDFGQGVIKFFSDLGGVIDDDDLSKRMSAIDSLKSALETIGNLGDAGVSDVLQALEQIKEAGTTLGTDLMPMEGEDGIAYYQRLTEAVEEYTQAQHEAMLASLNLTEEQYQQMLKEQEAAKAAKEAAEEAKKAEEERLEGYRDLLKEMRNAEANTKAGKMNYVGQLGVFSQALSSGGANAVVSMWDKLGETNKEMQTAIQQRFPQFAKAVAQAAVATGDLTEETSALDEALKSAQEQAEKFTQLDQVKYLQETASEVKKLAEDNGDLTKAFETFYSESKNVIEAQEEYAKISEQAGGVSKATADDVQKLVKALGWPANSILKNWDLVGAELDNAGTEIDDLYSQLQKDAILRITGTSEADFSNVESGLFSVAADAEQTIAALAALGAYEVDEEELEATMPLFDTVNGKTARVGDIQAMGTQKILRWPKINGAGGGGGGGNTKGGGGGGGGNKTKTTRGSARVLQTMSNIQDLQQNTQSLYQAQAGYYEQTGQLQGVILYRQKEIEALEKMNETLETNLTELEQWIDAKKEELGTLDESSEEYKEVYGELEALMERHQEYTLAVIENKTQVVSLTDSIRDLKNEIRDMQIDVYNEVVNALKARDEAQQKLEERQKKELDATVKVQKAILDVMDEQKQKSDKMRQGALNIEKLILNTIKQQDAAIKRMLQGRIAMEQTVLSIIQAQAAAAASIQQGRLSMENTIGSVIRANIEKQRDAAVKAAQEADQAASSANERQIEALREQRDLLDEQLKLRKEMAKAQDRQAELAELEAQYARISADPTRMKEALKIREQIDKLRDEIAWDIAEKEVEAQQKAIDEQIDALSGQEFNSASAVSEYYDKLLDDTEAINAQIEEMLDTMSDSEIIEWLKENSEEYQDSTRTGKKAMVEDWQDQLNQMRGVTESFVNEIDAVLSGSREEILEWLKENDLEYAKASDAQKQQMVQDWEDALNEMYGITETHWDKVKEVMESGLEGFLDFMERNNTEYAEMSDTEKEITKQGWIDTWNEMTGEVEDHREDVASIMQEGYDAFLEYMMQNSEAFKTATAEEKLSMINSWKEMWDSMNTTTKNYEDEANAIIAQGQQAIIDTLTEYTENYAEVGRLQSEKYVDEWTSKLAELETALASVSSMVDTVGSKYEALVATGAVDKANEIDSAKADTTIDALLDQAGLEHFAAGGLATKTGPVWVDGSPQFPERILSPYQTELFSVLVRSMEEMSRVSIPTLPNFGGDFMTGGSNSSLSFGDIIVNVEHLDSDTDYDDMAGHVLDSVMEKINRSAVVGGIRYSR